MFNFHFEIDDVVIQVTVYKMIYVTISMIKIRWELIKFVVCKPSYCFC